MCETDDTRHHDAGDGAPDLLQDARRVEAGHQEIYRIQLELGDRIEQLRAGWSTADAAGFYGDYELFDGAIERIKESLDLMHGHLVAAHRSHHPAGADQ